MVGTSNLGTVPEMAIELSYLSPIVSHMEVS